ncbi:MAG TPA: ATP-dependent metalloprotease, partial [Pseudomonadales bacterium]|nr:ATP-dependent metalloprotease [Pseudomonadales bacterium]
VYKVSIIPRGRALGVTMFLPEEDKYSHSRRALTSMICSLFGGRIAEELILGADGITTGASNDIQRATEIARNMVTKWGLSERMGPLLYDESQEEVFLGRAAAMGSKHTSDDTAKKIDEEVRRIVDEAYATARKLLVDNIDKLHAMADALVQYETLDTEQIDAIMGGRKAEPPEHWSDRGGGRPAAPPAGGDVTHADDKPASGPIGGPAGEH